MNVVKYTIPFLKEELSKYNLSTKGKKAELQERLFNYYDEIRENWKSDIIYVSDTLEFSKKDEVFLGTRYNTIYGNGLLRFEKNQDNYDMYIDRNLLKKYIIEEIKIPNGVIEAIINIYTSKLKKTRKSIKFPHSSKPSKFNHKIIQQHTWIKTTLYQHQLESIYWMKKLEQKIQSNTLFYKYKTNGEQHMVFPEFDPSLIFDIQNKKIVIGSNENTLDYYMKTSGGILADEVGLGKTLTIISLFIENNTKNQIFNKIDPIKYNFYPNCNCNLVICPGYLVDQWSNEIFKHIQPPLKHYIITGKKQHEELTYKNLLTSDVIIVSDKFLRSNYYNSLKLSFSDLQLNNKNPLETTSPLLYHIEWNRIILDEGHLILSNDINCEQIDKISSKFRWFVSATPEIKHLQNFLKWNVENDNIEPFINSFYLSRTKKEVKNVIIPDYTEEIDLITMTYFERQIYENYRTTGNKLLLRQLCSSILVCDEFKEQKHKTLKEFQTHLMNENHTKIKEISNIIIKKEKEIEYYNHLIEQEKDKMPEELFCQTEKNIEILQEDIKNYNLETQNLSRSIGYQENVLKNMEQKEHTCLICFDAIDKENIIITSCCHIYCAKCVNQITNCSICRKPFTTTHLNIQEDLQSKLIHYYGSKIAKLINHLQKIKSQNPDFKALIYSQWNKMLTIISECLSNAELNHVICNNNMKQIKSILEKFQHDSNIMLLSLQSHHSGLDLHNATHIFFMDVLDEKSEEIETQAIGRAYRIGQTEKIKIVRLVMKDTIEHEIFEKSM